MLLALLLAVATPPTIVTTSSSPQCTLLRENTAPVISAIAQSREMFARDDATLLNASIDLFNHDEGHVALDVMNLESSATKLAANIALIGNLLGDKRYATLDYRSGTLTRLRDDLKESLVIQKLALNRLTGFTESWRASRIDDWGPKATGIGNFTLSGSATTAPNLMVPVGYQFPKNRMLTYFASQTPAYGAAIDISNVQLDAVPFEHHAAKLFTTAWTGC